ncbi:MAG: kelch repeat-containing protein [Tepidisphaerales bacterium]
MRAWFHRHRRSSLGLVTGRTVVEILERRTLLSALSWTDGPPLPAALGNAAALETSLGVLLVGGATSANGITTPTNAQLLDPIANTWGSAPAIDQGRSGLGLGATGSYGPTTSDGYKYLSDVFLLGGASQGQATSGVYNYNLYGKTGVDPGSAPSMGTARYDLAAATDPATGSLYAIGGLDSSNHALASVERYSPVSDSWSAVASLPVALYGASAASDGAGHILVFGGDTSAGAPVNTVYGYTIASDTWAAVSTMPIAASGTAAVFGAYGQIYLVGGLTAGGPVDTVYVFNPVTGQWTTDTPLPSAVYDAAAAIDSNNNLDVIGGFASGGSAVASVYQSPALPAPVGLPAVPTVTVTGNWYLYDGAPHAVAGSAVGTDGVTPVAGSFAFTYDGSSTVPVNAGTYKVIATFTSADPQYVDAVAQGVLYISAAAPVLTLSGGGTITYDGSPHPITATAIGIDGSTPVSGTFAFTYNGQAAAPVNPGTYAVVATFTSSDPNYANATASTTITIPDPTIPTGVIAAGASTTSIQVSWNPVPGAAHYNVYRRDVAHSPKGSGATIYYTLVTGNLTGTSIVITVPGLSTYTFAVTSVSAAGVESPRSALVSAMPQYAPSLYSFLWGGAVMSSASVEVGQTLHVTLLGYGNLAPTYTMDSGPATMSVDPGTGVVTYTPGANEVGYTTATFTATNSVASSTATFSFHVLALPTVVVTGGTFAYDGNTHAASAIAYGTDGVTPINGTFRILYAPAAYPNALSTAPYAEPGTYSVQATFTSSDPNYGGASGAGTVTIDPATMSLAATANATLYARLSPDRSTLQVWQGSAAIGAPANSFPNPGYPGFDFVAGAGNATLILDISNGLLPVPITFVGAAGPSTITITGIGPADTIAAQPGQIVVDSTSIFTTGSPAIRLDAPANSALALASLALSTPVSLTPAGNLVLRTGSLSITAGGSLDLAGNGIILDYTGQAPLSSVRQWLQNGRIGVTPALLTSAQPASGTPALGLVDNALLHLSSFAGQSLGGVFSQLLIRSTVAGDTNLDGVVDQQDYLNVLANMGSTSAQWFQGDLNYDGLVTPDDLAVVTANLGASVAGPQPLPAPAAAASPRVLARASKKPAAHAAPNKPARAPKHHPAQHARLTAHTSR